MGASCDDSGGFSGPNLGVSSRRLGWVIPKPLDSMLGYKGVAARLGLGWVAHGSSGCGRKDQDDPQATSRILK